MRHAGRLLVFVKVNLTTICILLVCLFPKTHGVDAYFRPISWKSTLHILTLGFLKWGPGGFLVKRGIIYFHSNSNHNKHINRIYDSLGCGFSYNLSSNKTSKNTDLFKFGSVVSVQGSLTLKSLGTNSSDVF